jgi:putative redox protein
MAREYKDVTAVWTEGLQFEAKGQSEERVLMDGNGRLGLGPMEMLLAGLAGCTGADVIDILKKKRQHVTGLEIRVHGDRASENPMKFTDIQVTFVLTGRNVDPEAVRRSIQLSETKYCGASATLRGVARITTSFEIHAAEPVAA